ncbi:hypothetical protein DENSPDRAFT_340172 [Dentipellis sp. KUC8613]|nr:hypothetical protein DENSPDRAFT_340172 [Dentipellis sp. KUC8613]
MSPAPVLVQPIEKPPVGGGSSPLGFILEPLIVISLLAGGVWFNRRRSSEGSHTSSPLLAPAQPSAPAKRDTSRYANNWISRTLYRYPFLLEVLYWALTYWIYQIARAISAVLFIDEGTVDAARNHGVQLLNFERALGIQHENAVQMWFIKHPMLISALNRIYSFIHIPATISFLAYFYHTQPPRIYAPVRRTLALANLLAFVVFTLWPCMPPRLLPAMYGFVDTVHKGSMGSVWTTNKFCNQFAAMPSLHFGYSLIVGLSLFTYAPRGSVLRRTGLHTLFLGYPALILLAIVATANHYFLDALAGLVVAALAFQFNRILLALLPLENFVFYYLHIHKPPAAGRLEDGEKRRSCGGFVWGSR